MIERFDIDGRAGVGIACVDAVYPTAPPYSPAMRYPEYPFGDEVATSANHAYAGVREALRAMGLDAGRYDTPSWNPLGEVIGPGQTVVLKPNFVRDFRETHDGHGDCTTTHGSVIRAVCDYVYIALQGKGRIVIADAPHNDAVFERLIENAGIAELQAFYRRGRGFEIECYDLRPEAAQKINGVIVGHFKLRGDPAGYVKCNLGKNSAFHEINHLCHLLYGSEYDMSELHSHQHDETHEYLISKTVLSADCVIGLPKLKTHKKVGLTVNLKNLVGINGNKNWLPHHREGTPGQGGDQFAEDTGKRRFERTAVAKFKRVFPMLGPLRAVIAGPIKRAGSLVFGDTNRDTIRSGNWYGNDTTWRMTLDLNRILAYADADGQFHDQPVRSFLSIVDGIVAGEGNGPLDPTAKSAGIVLAGANPVAVDLVSARLMGFDYRKLPILSRAFADHPWPLARFEPEMLICRCSRGEYNRALGEWVGACLGFVPHFGWRGHIEVERA